MSLPTARYLGQAQVWPTDGEHILAHHDDKTVIVYQAYRPEIGRFAIEHGRLDGPAFSLNRMSWIKPNFLWMMYRSGWGTKSGQEITLALRLRRAFFDEVLAKAVASSHGPSGFGDRGEWQEVVAQSEVRLQWDPDHAPDGARLSRRAVQLGLRGVTLARFAREELLEVIDMSAFVEAQRPHATGGFEQLSTPVESPYDAPMGMKP
jgi:hypothetical protein